MPDPWSSRGRHRWLDLLKRKNAHKARADRIAVNHPNMLSMNRIQTAKKPPVLVTTIPGECKTIMPAPIMPPKSMMI